ncbi:hypothetical protein EON66_04250 [archaeon]|nr:MAG: hypothetical protein EON66_04250 [archaeon]
MRCVACAASHALRRVRCSCTVFIRVLANVCTHASALVRCSVRSPTLFAISGQWQMVHLYGAHYTYNATSRALIFARDQGKVVDEATLRALIRYNDFEHDPLAIQGCLDNKPSGSNAIAERGDLTPKSYKCIPDVSFQDEAALDAKYTSASRMLSGNLVSVMQAGPTYYQQPVFSWSNTSLTGIAHVGQPDTWNFPWIEVDWQL